MEFFAWRALALRWTIFVAAFSLAGAAAVDRDLEQIKQKIATEKKGLSQLQTKEGSVRRSLDKIESELDKRTKELTLANKNLASLANEMDRKQAEAARLDRAIASRLEILQKRSIALYRWRKSGSPLLVLDGNGSDATFLQRRRYLETALSFDRELLAKLDEEKQRHKALRQELAQKKEDLDDQTQALSVTKDAIRREAEEKKVLLASLRREKEARSRELREMEAASHRLAKMLEEISRRSVSKTRETLSRPTTGAGLESMRGRLDWPVRGQVSAPFGKVKHPEFAAEVFRNGIDINAPIGEEIKAVEKGRIVYADGFAGYGRMVVVDHGERYFTIYGHLSEIIRKNGEDIARGEVIGKVGDGATLEGSKLYFEMRKDGRSLDPVPWFKKR